jgi:pimeloyl-ACP methyl ester carboxylesterase
VHPESYAIQLSSGRISVIDQGQGLPVLLGHGLLWGHAMCVPHRRALRRHCRVLVPEMWGHGASGALPPSTRSLADIADHMIELLDALHIERCVIVGSSIGGMWGAHLAARAPQRVAGLAIMNSFLGQEPKAQRTVYAAILDRVAEEGAISSHVADLIVPLFFGPDIARRAPELPRELRRRLSSFTPDQLRRSIVPLGRILFDRRDALPILSQIEAPTLVLAGADDRVHPVDESRIMTILLDCGLTVVADCGHTATLEQPGRVNAALLDFLGRLSWTQEIDQRAAG